MTEYPYQDAAVDLAERVADLMGRMSVEEKAGLLFHPIITMNADGSLVDDAAAAPSEATTGELVTGRLISHFNLLSFQGPGAPGAGVTAEWHNALQRLAAEETRWGIPVTLSTDPRHAFTDNAGSSMAAGPFSQWPEPLGLAALGDVETVREFADIARQEYLAVGFRVALHPQFDLATEPRWARIAQTFGEDADLAARLGVAYLEGLRGGRSVGPDSVAAMAKHFPGGGPQRGGEDPHFPHGKEQDYPGGMFDYHLRPFLAAITAGVTQIMPSYGVPIATAYDEVAFGFNDGVINGLLRTELGFDGIVCTDWAIINDHRIMGEPHSARAWGVEHLSALQRTLMALNAGVDQFGGESRPELVAELVRSGRLPAERLDQSVRRLLTEKFRLGLFDRRRYVDPELADRTAGKADFRAAGRRAQSASVTVLVNRDGRLPAPGRLRLFVEGVDPAVAAEYADVVTDPAQADLALLRLSTPYEQRPGRFESLFHTGPLDFEPGRLAEILALLRAVPTVVAIHLERPAVIPEISSAAAAVLAVFGASDAAVLDVVFGAAEPKGRLPVQLPRSMDEVRRGRPDVPRESADPLFDYGDGLRLDLPL
ncbi:MAG TPA: glycoside hydrolase family 3 N-terminal domain-containing protein [Trebonia sp.]|nr:glycoside hydrolase family 3 N-terminal domain-containing protein [Trebonia sp.]